MSFTVGGKYKMTGILNAQNQVERVQTWIDQPIVGDMLVETTYSGYKDFGGVMFPSRLVQKQDGFPSLDLTIACDSKSGGRHHGARQREGSAATPVRVDSAKMGEGVYYLTGGTHHSLVVEMKDHIVLVDTPNDARGHWRSSRRRRARPEQANPLRRDQPSSLGSPRRHPFGD